MTGVEVLAAATVASTAVSAFSMVQQGQQAKKIGKYNRQVAEVEAQRTRNAAQFEEDRLRRRVRSLIGTSRARAAAQGSVIEGSPLSLIEETVSEAELDAKVIRQSADADAARLTAQGAISDAEGRAAARRSFVGAFGTVVQGGQAVHSLTRPRGVSS